MTADDDDEPVHGLPTVKVGSGLHLVATVLGLRQQRMHDAESTVDQLP